MPKFRQDFANVARANREAIPYLLAANERLKSHNVGLNRFCRLLTRRLCLMDEAQRLCAS